MPVTPKEQKDFLELIAAGKRLAFAEATAVFADKGGKLNPKTITPTLRFLWNEFLFEVQRADTSEEVRIDEALFEAPGDYVIQFVGFEGKENAIAENYADEIDHSDIDELEEHYCWAGVRARDILRIIGDQDEATLLAERIRAFTHYLAFNLVVRNDHKVDVLFSDKVAEKQSAAGIRSQIAALEKEYGKFDHFDHVKVITVYNGEHRDTKTSEDLPLPRGVDRAARRGRSTFNLISVHTPNGVAIHEYIVDLSIIEEHGLFRVSGSRMYSGY
jgi:hypothetical protein